MNKAVESNNLFVFQRSKALQQYCGDVIIPMKTKMVFCMFFLMDLEVGSKLIERPKRLLTP